MSVRFACPHCRTILKAPDGTEGKRSRCPSCKSMTVVPHFEASATLDKPARIKDTGSALVPHRAPPDQMPMVASSEILDVLPLTDDRDVLDVLPANDLLTPCAVCSRSIAKEAATCPGCGAPNKWLHPEIVRFLGMHQQFAHIPRFELRYEKYLLEGVDQRSAANAQALTGFVNSIGVVAPMNLDGLTTLAGAHFGRQWLNQWAAKKVKAFALDFHTSPPAWWKTDDHHWREVLWFFGIRLIQNRSPR